MRQKNERERKRRGSSLASSPVDPGPGLLVGSSSGTGELVAGRVGQPESDGRSEGRRGSRGSGRRRERREVLTGSSSDAESVEGLLLMSLHEVGSLSGLIEREIGVGEAEGVERLLVAPSEEGEVRSLRTRHWSSPALGKGTSRHRRGPASGGRTRRRVEVFPLESSGLFSDDFLGRRVGEPADKGTLRSGEETTVKRVDSQVSFVSGLESNESDTLPEDSTVSALEDLAGYDDAGCEESLESLSRVGSGKILDVDVGLEGIGEPLELLLERFSRKSDLVPLIHQTANAGLGLGDAPKHDETEALSLLRSLNESSRFDVTVRRSNSQELGLVGGRSESREEDSWGRSGACESRGELRGCKRVVGNRLALRRVDGSERVEGRHVEGEGRGGEAVDWEEKNGRDAKVAGSRLRGTRCWS